MYSTSRNRSWFILPALIVASCAQGDAQRLAGPTASAADGAALVGSLAAGDVKTGSAPLEIDAVRLDRQSPPGTSVLRRYAEPGGEYRIRVGETIELWVEWDRGDGEFPSGLIANPRLLVDWGEGEVEFTGCGSCKLSHIYRLPGRYAVRVTLKESGGTTVTRTFFLSTSEEDDDCTPPTLNPPVPEFECDVDGTFDTSPFFLGSDLRYSLGGATCVLQQDAVRAQGNVESIEIDELTGVITASDGTYCTSVMATNACGSASFVFVYGPFSCVP